MSDVIKPVVIRSVMICEEDRDELPLYEEMFAPLIQTVRKCKATLDLTMIRQPIILGATAKCRKAIRHQYGSAVQEHRQGRVMYLQGF